MNQTGLASHVYILQEGFSVFLAVLAIIEICKKQKKLVLESSFQTHHSVCTLESISFLLGRLSLETRKDEGGQVLNHNCVGGYPVASQIEIHLSKVAILLWPKKLNKKNVINSIWFCTWNAGNLSHNSISDGLPKLCTESLQSQYPFLVATQTDMCHLRAHCKIMSQPKGKFPRKCSKLMMDSKSSLYWQQPPEVLWDVIVLRAEL